MTFLDLQYIVAPVVGGVIGYITNGIAIKMLFRPLNPIKLWGFTLPFTPGLIPKEKERLAASIGGVVGTRLLNSEVISAELISPEILKKLEGFIDSVITEYKTSETKVSDIIGKAISEDTLNTAKEYIKENAVRIIKDKMLEMNVGQLAAASVVEKVKAKISGSFMAMISMFVDDNTINSISGQLAEIVNKMIEENTGELVGGIIDTQTENLLETSISDIIIKQENKIPEIKGYLIDMYVSAVKNNIYSIMEHVDISKIVVTRINSFDTLELERLILSIINKELSAIIWLGAALGFIIGLASLFIR